MHDLDHFQRSGKNVPKRCDLHYFRQARGNETDPIVACPSRKAYFSRTTRSRTAPVPGMTTRGHWHCDKAIPKQFAYKKSADGHLCKHPSRRLTVLTTVSSGTAVRPLSDRDRNPNLVLLCIFIILRTLELKNHMKKNQTPVIKSFHVPDLPLRPLGMHIRIRCLFRRHRTGMHCQIPMPFS